jgi:hypothetical protein
MARMLFFSTYQLALYDRLQHSTGRHTRRCRRQSCQGGRLSPRPRHAVGAASRRRHRRVTPAHAGRPRRGRSIRRRAVHV